MRRSLATILLLLAAAGLAVAVAVVVSGGLAWPRAGISARDPWRPLLAAVVLLVAARAVVTGAEFRQRLARYTGAPGRRALRVAIVAAVALSIYACSWSSRAAGGSDSSCYVLQAEAFAHGHATLVNPVAAVLPGAPNAVFAPTGFIPSPREYGAAVPICAPGLSLAMALAYRIRPAAVFAIVPLSAALLVGATFVYGRRVDDDVTGAYAAVLVACSPIVLYQAVQPMSDVPAAAAWMLALVSASPLGAGLWASVAVLTRPNLAILTPLLVLKRGQSPFLAKNGDSPLFRAGAFAAAAAPGLALMLALNAARYGRPLATGYGSTDVLFSAAHVYANLLRYPRWLLETQTPFVLLALAAPWTLWRDRPRAWLAALSLCAAGLLTATYLAYTVFDDWWYIRFLLPALPILVVLSVSVLRRLVSLWLPPSRGLTIVTVLCAALCFYYVHVARERHVMDLQRLESRFALTGGYAATALPANAVALAVQQSGSIRFHGRRDTISWDAIPADALDATLLRLRSAGRAPVIVLEDAEESGFRSRFAAQQGTAALDAEPSATVHAPVRVRFYVPPE